LVAENKINNWNEAKETFLKRQVDQQVNTEAISLRKQLPYESATDFIYQKEALYGQIKPPLNEEFIVRETIRSLKNEIKDRVTTATITEPIKTIDDLVVIASAIETSLNALIGVQLNPKVRRTLKEVEFEDDGKIQRRNSKEEDEELDPGFQSMIKSEFRKMNKDLQKWQFSQEQHCINTLNPISEKGNQKRDVICYNCGKIGHISRHCFQPQMVICYNCRGDGHISRECPHPRRPRRNESPITQE
jgi:hypothetical protein